MLENFKKGGFHLSLVTREVKSSQDSTTEELVGIVTLEDILEEIICAEIVDETDKYMSNRGKNFFAGPKTLSKGVLGVEFLSSKTFLSVFKYFYVTFLL